MDDLIERGTLKEIADHDPPVDSLVMYYNGEELRHCGVIITPDKRVRSKINIYEFLEHDLVEIKRSYGNGLRYFEAPSDSIRQEIIVELKLVAIERKKIAGLD